MTSLSGTIETDYICGASLPWIPFTPLNEKLLLKYFRIDPLRGEMLLLARFPPDRGVAPFYHTGPVIAHTLRGAWRFREQDWISRSGDTVHDAAGSIGTVESVGDQEALVFLMLAGELLFFDEDGGLVWQESWKTSVERYAEYCAAHRLSQHDLTGTVGATGVIRNG